MKNEKLAETVLEVAPVLDEYFQETVGGHTPFVLVAFGHDGAYMSTNLQPDNVVEALKQVIDSAEYATRPATKGVH
jgi:hypothetical protein